MEILFKMLSQQNYRQQTLWGITAYYNPCGYKRRRHNYKIFKNHLAIPLVTVELSYSGRFELSVDDADILIQLSGRDVMWQKERLLNIAIEALPETCRQVAWLDCDIIIPNSDWVIDTINKLDTYKIIQPYKRMHHLPPDMQVNQTFLNELSNFNPLLSEYSFAFIQNSGVQPPKIYNNRKSGTSKIKKEGCPGLFWAARKEVLLEHRFYDAFIVGGGDTSIAFAAIGKHDYLIEQWPMSFSHKKHYGNWAKNFFNTINNSISHIDYEVYHLWHGDFNNRQYYNRYSLLKNFDYDPATDIGFDDNRCFHWTNDKTAMHKSIEDYFYSRKEDG